MYLLNYFSTTCTNEPGVELGGEETFILESGKSVRMLLRIYSLVLLGTLIAVVGYFFWLLYLPFQPGFTYDVLDARYILVGYLDFVFLTITTLTIVFIIGRTSFETALQTDSLSAFDRRLYTTMSSLPLILICFQCLCILLAVFVASLSIGVGYF